MTNTRVPRIVVRGVFLKWTGVLLGLAMLGAGSWALNMERRLSAENEVIKRNLAGNGPGKRILRERLNELRREARGPTQPPGKPDYFYDTMSTWEVGGSTLRFPYHFMGRRVTLDSIEFYAILPRFDAPSPQTYFGVKRKFGEGWSEVVSISLVRGPDLRELDAEVSGLPVRRRDGLVEYANGRYESADARSSSGAPIGIVCTSIASGKVGLRCLSRLAMTKGLFIETRFDATHLQDWSSILARSRAMMQTFITRGVAPS